MFIMKKGFVLVLSVVSLVLAGCSGGEDDALPSAAPAPAGGADVGVATAPPSLGTPEPGATTAPATAEPVEPQLAPIQIAIQTFEQQNKRMPLNVQEILDTGILKDLPPPPPGKLYYIDHATKKVKLGSGP